MDTNKVLVGALQQCDTKELLDDTFSKFGISDYSQKTIHLIEAMGNPTIFFSDDSIESRYSTVLSMFLTGEWKMDKFYDRAMLIKIEQLICDCLSRHESHPNFFDLQLFFNRIGEKLRN